MGELTMQLHPGTDSSPAGSRWTEPEPALLRGAVSRFREDLNRLSALIKDRTVAAAKRKAYEDSGVPLSPRRQLPQKTPPDLGERPPTTPLPRGTASEDGNRVGDWYSQGEGMQQSRKMVKLNGARLSRLNQTFRAKLIKLVKFFFFCRTESLGTPATCIPRFLKAATNRQAARRQTMLGL
uniref:Uncharacterized protein n=1 Tax=Geospiza parvula TaxID=87175 RepID=A0A8U8CHV7_GEOPR